MTDAEEEMVVIEPIVCPRCGTSIDHRFDVRFGYCITCHDYSTWRWAAD